MPFSELPEEMPRGGNFSFTWQLTSPSVQWIDCPFALNIMPGGDPVDWDEIDGLVQQLADHLASFEPTTSVAATKYLTVAQEITPTPPEEPSA